MISLIKILKEYTIHLGTTTSRKKKLNSFNSNWFNTYYDAEIQEIFSTLPEDDEKTVMYYLKDSIDFNRQLINEMLNIEAIDDSELLNYRKNFMSELQKVFEKYSKQAKKLDTKANQLKDKYKRGI